MLQLLVLYHTFIHCQRKFDIDPTKTYSDGNSLIMNQAPSTTIYYLVKNFIKTQESYQNEGFLFMLHTGTAEVLIVGKGKPGPAPDILPKRIPVVIENTALVEGLYKLLYITPETKFLLPIFYESLE